MTTGIYGVFSSKDNECLYVGQSGNIEARWRQHITKLRNKRSCALQSFVDWYHLNGGTEDILYLKILEECANIDKNKNILEKHYFELLNPKFFGKKPSLLETWAISEETKNKISVTASSKITILDENIILIRNEAINRTSTMKELSEKLGVGYTKMKAFCKDSDIKFKRKIPAWGNIDEYPILDMYLNKRMTMNEISKVVGCSSPIIVNYIKSIKHTDVRFEYISQGKNIKNIVFQ